MAQEQNIVGILTELESLFGGPEQTARMTDMIGHFIQRASELRKVRDEELRQRFKENNVPEILGWGGFEYSQGEGEPFTEKLTDDGKIEYVRTTPDEVIDFFHANDPNVTFKGQIALLGEAEERTNAGRPSRNMLQADLAEMLIPIARKIETILKEQNGVITSINDLLKSDAERRNEADSIEKQKAGYLAQGLTEDEWNFWWHLLKPNQPPLFFLEIEATATGYRKLAESGLVEEISLIGRPSNLRGMPQAAIFDSLPDRPQENIVKNDNCSPKYEG